jgi:hypothetical protein
VVGVNWEFDGHKRSFTWQYVVNNFSNIILSGMSLEAGNQRKSPVTLAVTTGYFFSLKKIMRENLSSISNTT